VSVDVDLVFVGDAGVTEVTGLDEELHNPMMNSCTPPTELLNVGDEEAKDELT